MAGECDALIENFKVGGLAKFGLDAASLTALHPRLVYCSISGFGQTGPFAERAGYDFIIQGMSGLMDITGEPGREPQKVGVAVVDLFTGVYASTAILAALRRRDQSGVGAVIDLALMDCAVAMLANQAMNYLVSGHSPTRLGNAHPNIAPYQVFAVADGHVIVAVGNDRQFQNFCRAIDANAVGAEPDFATNPRRVAHRERLVAALAPLLKAMTREALLAKLEAAGVPAGPINRIEDVFADPQVIHRGLRLDLVGPDGAHVAGVASPIVIDGERMTSDRPSPRLGDATKIAPLRLRLDSVRRRGPMQDCHAQSVDPRESRRALS